MHRIGAAETAGDVDFFDNDVATRRAAEGAATLQVAGRRGLIGALVSLGFVNVASEHQRPYGIVLERHSLFVVVAVQFELFVLSPSLLLSLLRVTLKPDVSVGSCSVQERRARAAH